VTFLDELKLRIVASIQTVTPQMLKNRKLDTAVTSHVPRKARMLKLFSILQHGSTRIKLFELRLVFGTQFYFVVSDLKIIRHENSVYPKYISRWHFQ
jgi:hypothetical protein